jgi:imidazolonepropionase-like amidohydrolase
VTDEAARRGSYVAAHAYSPEAIRHSIDNGVRGIEHGNLLDAQTAAAMASARACLVPTLAAYDAIERRGEQIGMPVVSRHKNREVLESGKQAVGLARAAGVSVGFGTALDIPLKVLVWEDSNGAVSVSYNSPGFLAERHHLEGALRAPFDAVESIVEALPGA